MVRVAAVPALAALALLVASCSFGQANRLAVGDCFNPPTTIGETVSDIATIPCTSPHGAEVVAVIGFEPASPTLPSEDDLRTFFNEHCPDGFNDYTGLDFDTADYDMSALTPTPEDWANGLRSVVCYAVPIGEEPLTKSIRKP